MSLSLEVNRMATDQSRSDIKALPPSSNSNIKRRAMHLLCGCRWAYTLIRWSFSIRHYIVKNSPYLLTVCVL